MRLSISSFADPGNLEKERIVIKAMSDLDIGTYLLLRSSVSSEGSPTAGRKSVYWFPDGMVKAEDLIVLYTKVGERSKKLLSGGRTAHFFYWGYQKALWGTNDYTAVILRVSEWAQKIPGEA